MCGFRQHAAEALHRDPRGGGDARDEPVVFQELHRLAQVGEVAPLQSGGGRVGEGDVRIGHGRDMVQGTCRRDGCLHTNGQAAVIAMSTL